MKKHGKNEEERTFPLSSRRGIVLFTILWAACIDFWINELEREGHLLGIFNYCKLIYC